jgi:hypothetical protein
MLRMSRGISSPFLLIVLGVWIAVALQARVDGSALRDAAKTGEDWISYNPGWSEQRYSPLNQINAGNFGRLGLAWSSGIPSAVGPGETVCPPDSLRFQNADVAQVPVLLGIVKSVPHHELVGNFESDIRHVNRPQAALRLVEQRGDPYRVRFALLQ